MYLLSPRDGRVSFEKTCRSVSWRVWCPIDIALWVTIVLVLALLFWKLYGETTKEGDPDEQTPDIPLNAAPRDDLSIKNNTNHNCPCCISDPHLIVHSGRLERGSILTKDVSIPAPALLSDTQKKPSSRRLTGLGISFGPTSSTTDLPFQIPQIQGISRQGSSTDLYLPPSAMEIGNKSTPPPAYVRDIRTDRL